MTKYARLTQAFEDLPHKTLVKVTPVTSNDGDYQLVICESTGEPYEVPVNILKTFEPKRVRRFFNYKAGTKFAVVEGGLDSADPCHYFKKGDVVEILKRDKTMHPHAYYCKKGLEVQIIYGYQLQPTTPITPVLSRIKNFFKTLG